MMVNWMQRYNCATSIFRKKALRNSGQCLVFSEIKWVQMVQMIMAILRYNLPLSLSLSIKVRSHFAFFLTKAKTTFSYSGHWPSLLQNKVQITEMMESLLYDSQQLKWPLLQPLPLMRDISVMDHCCQNHCQCPSMNSIFLPLWLSLPLMDMLLLPLST